MSGSLGLVFLTKTKLWSRGLGGGFAWLPQIAADWFCFLTKIALTSAPAFRRRLARRWLVGLGQPSSRLTFRPPVCVVIWSKPSVLRVGILLCSATACPCLLREYVRCPIGMIFSFTAHQNSRCLSVLYAKFALPMDMIFQSLILI